MKYGFWLTALLFVLGVSTYLTQDKTDRGNSLASSKEDALSQPTAEVNPFNPAEPLSNVSQEELERLALNVNEQGDTRAEAIEKLSRKPDDHSLQTLTQLASRSLPKAGGGLFAAQERVFAAMAIEGILNHPSKDQKIKSIEAILRAQNDQFIVTRANMALGFIKGITPHPKEIDEKNLTNLFE